MTQRVSVVFDDGAVTVLQELQRATGKSAADVIRDALGFYDWAREHVEDGRSIAVVDHDKNRVREFIMPFRRAGG